MWTHRSFLVLLLHLAETTLFAPAAAESNREEAAPEVLPLIIGGTVAGLEQYPYYVHLSNGCGGSLIAPKVVLTAAHCIDGPGGTDNIDAFVGATVYMSVKNGAVRQPCVQWKIHKDWTAEELDEDSNLKPGTGVYGGYDFALCELDNPVNIDDSDVFLELNKDPGFPSEDADDVMTEAMGMGAIELSIDNVEYPEVLMRTDLLLLDNATCKARISNFDEATMMCTHSDNSSKCYGDSGGPVVVASPSSGGRTKHTQIGAVSYGNPPYCYDLNVEARVSSGIDWIRAVVCDEWKIEDAASLCETLSPSSSPSDSPTYSPTAQPSAPPSDSPSDSPSAQPSASPSDSPSALPSASPSVLPSALPSDSPSEPPSTIKSGKNGKDGKKATKKTKKKKNTKENKKGD